VAGGAASANGVRLGAPVFSVSGTTLAEVFDAGTAAALVPFNNFTDDAARHTAPPQITQL